MVWQLRAIAVGLLVTSSALSATQTAPMGQGAPDASPGARYCLRVEPITGSQVERILCMTRSEWWEQEVDVDREWAKEGVRVIG